MSLCVDDLLAPELDSEAEPTAELVGLMEHTGCHHHVFESWHALNLQLNLWISIIPQLRTKPCQMITTLTCPKISGAEHSLLLEGTAAPFPLSTTPRPHRRSIQPAQRFSSLASENRCLSIIIVIGVVPITYPCRPESKPLNTYPHKYTRTEADRDDIP